MSFIHHLVVGLILILASLFSAESKSLTTDSSNAGAGVPASGVGSLSLNLSKKLLFHKT